MRFQPNSHVKGLRIAPGNRDSRLPNVQAETGFQKGWFEIQDEGSQVVSDLVSMQGREKKFWIIARALAVSLWLLAANTGKSRSNSCL